MKITSVYTQMFKLNKKEQVKEKNRFYFGKDNFIEVISNSECLPGNTQEIELMNSDILITKNKIKIPLSNYVNDYIVHNELNDNSKSIDLELLWLEEMEVPDFCKKKILIFWNDLQKKMDENISKAKEFKKRFKKW